MIDQALIDKILAVAKDIGYGRVPPYSHCELFTAGAFDLIIPNVTNGDAFDLLTEVCQKYDEVKCDMRHLAGYIYLLEALAYATSTTELPRGMHKILTEVPAEKTKVLRRWYRIAG